MLWNTDLEEERMDLAIPLQVSGNGIGQVIAILYVAITSIHPRTIIIDEPHSFLHPGAIRILFEILRTKFPQHQYILSTHSPLVINAIEDGMIINITKEDAVSTAAVVNKEEGNEMRKVLANIGARLSDVFGTDNILWVEGKTEELCFPIILDQLTDKRLGGTSILGVVDVGRLEAQNSELIFKVYNKLSTGSGLLPPAVGFLFDTEDRTPEQMKDLERMAPGKVNFIPRKTYENYLISSKALSTLINSIEGFSETPVTPEIISEWLKKNGNDTKYGEKSSESDVLSEEWLIHVHGAKILEDMFKQLSDSKFTYGKVEYGPDLTKIIAESSPEMFETLVPVLTNALRITE